MQPRLTPAAEPALAIEGLTLVAGDVALVSDVSLAIQPGEMMGLVGESGCGKSVTALAAMRLLPEPKIRIGSGRILFDGIDLAQASAREMRAIRGGRIGMIFQEPMTSLNPVLTVGEQIAEPLIIHRRLGKAAAMARAAECWNWSASPSPAAPSPAIRTSSRAASASAP